MCAGGNRENTLFCQCSVPEVEPIVRAHERPRRCLAASEQPGGRCAGLATVRRQATNQSLNSVASFFGTATFLSRT